MSALDPKLSVVFDAIREALLRVADEDIGPRLEALARELSDDRLEVRHEAAAEHASALQAATVEARGRIASLTEQVRYLEARLADLDQMWRASVADRDVHIERAQATPRLMRALERFEGCASLSASLDACAAALADVAPRSALLMPRGAVWHVRCTNGFGPTSNGETRLQVPARFSLDELPNATSPVTVSAEHFGPDGLSFVQPAPSASGSLWPIAIGGAVVVLAYADGGVAGSKGPAPLPEWELLVSRVVAAARLVFERTAATAVLRSAGVLVSREGPRASA